MKTLILMAICCLLLTLKSNGQSPAVIHKYKAMPLTDTAYVYIELKLKKKDGLMEIWQQDLQTGERWYSVCPRDRKFPKGGSVLRMLRSKQEYID